MLVFDINISHGNVATCLRCGGIFHNDFIANLPLTLQLKEFWKSVNIWRSYRQKYSGMFFLTHTVDFIFNVSKTAGRAIALTGRWKRCETPSQSKVVLTKIVVTYFQCRKNNCKIEQVKVKWYKTSHVQSMAEKMISTYNMFQQFLKPVVICLPLSTVFEFETDYILWLLYKKRLYW